MIHIKFLVKPSNHDSQTDANNSMLEQLAWSGEKWLAKKWLSIK